MWSWEALDFAQGKVQSLLNPRSVQITRNLNAPSTIQMVLDGKDVGSTVLSQPSTILRGWRSPFNATTGTRVVRATGSVLTVTAKGGTDQLESLKLAATDGLGMCANRFSHDPLFSFLGSPAGNASALIAYTFPGTTPLTVTDQTTGGGGAALQVLFGKNILELINDMAASDSGFFYRVDPISGSYAFSNLVLLYPNSGVNQPKAKVEYGPGTLNNCSSMQVDISFPINSVIATGSGSGIDQLSSQKSDATSKATYGTLEDVVSFQNDTTQDAIDQHAISALKPLPRRIISVEFASPTGVTQNYALSPWDSFDVGDTVQVLCRSSNSKLSALQFQGTGVVYSFTVSIDANGTERLTDLTLGNTSLG